MNLRQILKEKKEYIFLFVTFIVYMVYYFDSKLIIHNGKNYLWFVLLLLSALIWYLVKRKSIKQKKLLLMDGIFNILFLSFLTTLFLLIIINKYNIYIYSSDSSSQTELCEITGISKSRRNRGVYVIYKGKPVFLKGYREEFIDIEHNDGLEKYLIEIDYKEGMLNTDVIQDFYFKKNRK